MTFTPRMPLFAFHTLAGTPDVSLACLVTPSVLGRVTSHRSDLGPQQEAVIIRVREVKRGHVITLIGLKT